MPVREAASRPNTKPPPPLADPRPRDPGAFFILLLIAAYAGLTPLQLGQYVNDKVLHFLTFFLLTVVFYWILDTTRRRNLNLTLIICTGGLGIGSEVLQSLLPNGRDFDLYDILANIVGSLAAVGLCTLYHKRMLERRRAQRGYGAVPGEDDGADVELGENGGQEEGVVDAVAPAQPARTLEDEVDNWDENAVDDWDDEEDVGKNKTKDGDLGSTAKRDD